MEGEINMFILERNLLKRPLKHNFDDVGISIKLYAKEMITSKIWEYIPSSNFCVYRFL